MIIHQAKGHDVWYSCFKLHRIRTNCRPGFASLGASIHLLHLYRVNLHALCSSKAVCSMGWHQLKSEINEINYVYFGGQNEFIYIKQVQVNAVKQI